MKSKHDENNPLNEQKSLDRRRLIRGVVSAAPVILTLRSGGVAAASCVPARTVNVTLGGNGSIPSTVAGVQVGDTCYRVEDVLQCGTTPRLQNDADHPTISYNVIDQGGLRCSGASNNQQVAILSSGAATSFLA